MRNLRTDTRVGTLSRLGLVAALYAVLFAVLYYATVRTVDGRRLSDASLRGAVSTSPVVESTVDAVLNVVSTASLVGAVAVVAVVALVRLARLEGLAAIGILVASNLSTLMLKDHLLARPDLGLHEVAPATLNSLPSGHSTAAFSAVAALVFVLPHRARLTAATVGAAFAALTGVATMAAGWHRAADSMAAFLVVGFWTAVAATVVVAVGPPPARVDTPETGASPRRWLAATAAGCATLAAVILVPLSVTPPVRESTIGRWAAFFAAAFLITGTVSAVLVGVLRSLDLMDRAGSHGR